MIKCFKCIIFCALLFTLIHCARRAADPLPQQVLGFNRTSLLSGEEARRVINRLHNNEVTPQDNKIAGYSGPSGQATIYVTFYTQPGMASKEFRRMTEKISAQNSVFIQGQYLDMAGHRLYRCFGMGQTHYVFFKDRRLYWVAVETTAAKSFIEELLNKI